MPREQTQEYWIDESVKDTRFEDCYNIITELGKGATSVVYKCEHKGTHEAWAVKVINKRVEKKVIRTEIGILLKINHTNVIRMKEVYETPKQIYLVLELVKGGELFDRIVSRGCYSEKDAAKAVHNMLLGVQYLHEQGVVHRDLKPENLLYEDSKDESPLKLSDFGLSKIMDTEVQMNTVCGTPGYCAPEVLNGSRYNEKVDIWSIGVITYILLCGYEPFYDADDKKMFRRILNVAFDFNDIAWENVSGNAKDFITWMLNKNPQKRPSAYQALRHPWVMGIAAKNNHMHEAHEKIKVFNASRKMKAITDAAILATRAGRIAQSLNDKFMQLFTDEPMQSPTPQHEQMSTQQHEQTTTQQHEQMST